MKQIRAPYTIKIFLPDGDPRGLRVLERPNWTGIALVFSRTGFKEAINRPELKQAGVYILIGDPPDDGTLPHLYIGEGDPILDRLKNHHANKDFWSSAIAITSKDNSLNKAHIQYLENRLIRLAKEAKLSQLENNNFPTPPSLTESDIADTDRFFSTMLGFFPLVGLFAFERSPQHTLEKSHLLYIKNKGITASAIETPEGFLVLKGSQATFSAVASCPDYIKRQRNDLLSKGLFVQEKDLLTFTENFTFSSPSTAASIVLARSANGRIEWKTAQGKTLKERQEEESG